MAVGLFVVRATIAVDRDVAAAIEVRTSDPMAAAGWKTIEFSDTTVVRCAASTSRWRSVMCIGLEAPWAR